MHIVYYKIQQWENEEKNKNKNAEPGKRQVTSSSASKRWTPIQQKWWQLLRKRQCLSIILKPINNAAEMNLSTASNDYNEVNNLKKKNESLYWKLRFCWYILIWLNPSPSADHAMNFRTCDIPLKWICKLFCKR